MGWVKADRIHKQKHTCGVKSLVDLTAAWIPSTVLLLAVPTAAAFSAVAPSLLAWFSKLAALSSKTYKVKKSVETIFFFAIRASLLIKTEGYRGEGTDLISVRSIQRGSSSYCQQLNGGGCVTENVGHLLSHCLLHLSFEVLKSEGKGFYDRL